MAVSLDILPPAIDAPSCCTPVVADPSRGTKCHFSLNVTDMERSIAFYRVLFGTEPAKHHHDYAKFELAQPPLVFSLVPNPPAAGGALSHFGFPVDTTDEVESIGRRLAAAGLNVSCQNGTVCGYARQDKVWISDPDHNYWEIYVVHEDVDPESVRTGFDGLPPRPAAALPVLNAELPSAVTPTTMEPTGADPTQGAALWEHRVMEPLPDRIPQADNSLDVIRLEGTFNADFDAYARARLLADALRALKPGGEVQVHGLVSDQPVSNGLPALPGVAALVRRVPVESEPMQELEAAGFVGLRVTKLPHSPAFRSDGLELREIKLSGRKQGAAAQEAESRFVLYKGPFAEAMDDQGHVFRRGVRTPVSAQTWNELGSGLAASQFLFLGDPARDEAACS